LLAGLFVPQGGATKHIGATALEFAAGGSAGSSAAAAGGDAAAWAAGGGAAGGNAAAWAAGGSATAAAGGLISIASTDTSTPTTPTPPPSEPSTQTPPPPPPPGPDPKPKPKPKPQPDPFALRAKPAKLAKPKRAKAAIALDAATGKVLYKKNDTKGYSIASVSKLMTILLVREKLEQRGHSWKSRVPIRSRGLERMSRSSDCGGFRLTRGKYYTVSDLYKTTLIESSNASSIALGIWVSGSNARFIAAMNKRAKELGLAQTKFVSASGLDNKDLIRFGFRAPGTSKKATNKMSARDVAKLSAYLLKKYPDVVKVSKISKTRVRGRIVRTTNALLPGKYYYKKSLQVDGLKTGTTRSAGACFVATAKPKGRRRLITVVLDDRSRFPESRALLQSLYGRYLLKP
jgi:D-alanyl-D-alanine carboxypeptidase (penicillin-binding protein 5/6)